MNKKFFKVLTFITILAMMLMAMPMQHAQAVSTNIVISEFRVRGPNGGSDEFIELYNLSSSPVNIGGWKLNGSNSSGATSTRVTITAGVTLNPGCHYLVTNSSTSGGPYSGSVSGNQTYGTGITDDGGIALLNASNVIIDQVGMSTGSAYKEGTVLASLGSSNLNRSYERKPGGTSGSTTDTDNNASDFQLISPSDPQNLSSACVPSSNPTGVGTAVPSSVLAGQTTLLRVTVTAGSNPTSTGLAVTGDLSSIGGSSTQSFFDDGTNGDVTAGDNIFSFNATVTNTTTAGVKSLPFTVSDAQNRSSSGTISLTVVTNQAVSVNCDGPIITDVGVPDSATVVATDPDGRVVSISITGISPLPDPGSIFITNLVPAPVVGGTASADVNVDASVPAGTYTVNITATNDDAAPQTATCTLTVQAIAVTKIHDIQGSGSAVTGPGPFTVEAIVVGDYQTQGSGQLRGFFIQEEDADLDANPATSEGIFVFCSSCPVPVSVGEKVRVNGGASEFFNMSQLTASTVASVSVVSSGNPLPTPASIQLPVPGVPTGDLVAATTAINAYFEPFEGMLVTFPDPLSVSEYFELARYGQVILSEGGRPRQFTDANLPSVTGYIDHRIDLATRKIILDDTDNRQNRPVDTPNTAYYHPVPGLSITNFFRGGDTITNLTGVLHWSFAGQTGTDAWRIRPVTEAYSYAFTSVNARPSVPNVGGNTKVVSFNVLNYFLSVDTTASNSTGTCSPSGTEDCRGADSVQERDRQQAKLTAALAGLNADVFGLIELENTPNVDPLAEIVSDLNAATAPGTYAAVNTGLVGLDAIKVGLIYKPGAVTPIGAPMIDNDPVFSRPPVAQLFETTDGGRFTVVINHFKSKGCTDATGADLDQNDGQSCYNAQRVSQALALVDFVNDIASQTDDPDVLIIGDLNSYAKEDPITALENAGLTNLVATFGGPGAYGYLFDGQLGYLDHALSTSSLTPQVTGVADWHINADENPLFDYNNDVKDTGEAAFEEESDVLPLYEANEFRTSDHDPVVIGLELDGRPTVTVSPASQSVQYSDPIADVTITGMDASADIPLSISTEWNVDGGSFTAGLPSGLTLSSGTCGSNTCTWTLSGSMLAAPGSYTVRATVTDNDEGPTTVDITIEVTQEDARATYTGALYVSTSSTSSSNANVTLAATVQDISVTSDAAGDTYPGDIRNATVTFINRDTNTPIAGCTDLPVGLVNPSDLQTGTATCNWNVTISGDGQDFTIGIVVNNYYTRNSSDDNVVVMVAKPLASNFISGGGYLVLSNSAGQIAGDAGRKSNFGFNVKYTKKGTNLRGNVNIIVRRLEADGIVHVYQIKGNVMSSLAVQVGPGTATFNGKANIQDITDPLNPISIDGNAPLQIDLDDNGEPGNSDTIGITLWNKNGGLWFASNWDGVKTIQQILDGGNLVVR